jgi:hypothetical protein
MELIAWFIAAAVTAWRPISEAACTCIFPIRPALLRRRPALAGVHEVEIAVADNVTLVSWHAPAKEDKPTILYFHGNGANAANRAPKIETIRENGFGVFYLTNRGYGGSGGGGVRLH